jgi:threonylcarbamoyladenosine tRNA methylthiotransferase MtaB
VPEVRPHEYSLPASQVVNGVKRKVALGCKEVVLTGTKVGAYRHDGTDLKDLVQRILASTAVKRLRLSSLQPSEIFSGFLTLWQDERLCRHFHLALQSGSETVLRRMERSYSLDQYQRTADLIRDTIPDAAITTDVMVGFPGESDEEFEQSYSFCAQAHFANMHVFPYSPRPETAAAVMSQQIEDKVKQARNQRMLELSQSSRRRFREQFVGQTMTVLWEKEASPGSGIYSGLTGNYIRVLARSEKHLDNEVTPVKLVGFRNQEMWGELVNENPGQGETEFQD